MGLGGSRSVRICSHFCKCKGAPEFKSRTLVNDYDYEYMEEKKQFNIIVRETVKLK
jgi:hypothetical protein